MQSQTPAAPRQTGAFLFLLRYARRHSRWAALALVSVSFYALTSGATVYLLGPLFNEVLQTTDGAPLALPFAADPGPGGTAAGSSARDSLLSLKGLFDRAYFGLKDVFNVSGNDIVWFLPLVVVVVFWIRSLTDFLSGFSFQRIGLAVTTQIRNDLFSRIVHQSSRFHSAHSTGELVSRMVGDVGIVQVAVSTRVLDLFQQSATLLVLVALLLWADAKLALISLVLVPVVVFPIVRFGIGMRRTSRSSQERMADISRLLVEAARGHRVVRAFGMEEFETERFAKATRGHLRVRLRAEVFANASGPVVGAISVLGVAAFLVYAGGAIRTGDLTGIQVVQFLANLAMMYDPLRKLNKVHLAVQEAVSAVHRVIELMAIPLDVGERQGAKTVTGFRTKVAFERVSFAYDAVPVLSDVNLELRRGEVVALVGPSGAGKTTVASLLMRFADPSSGRVTIDGHDLREITFTSLHSLFSIVTQETVLFDDTIRNNIAYGRADVSLERVRDAAAAAFADEFIMRMPQGYETPIGEGGLRLSGGERQRIAIGRALLADTPILVLDEATSQLDSGSEAIVQKALTNLMRDRTTLLIAHRFSTITAADRIVVIDGGRIVEQGTHAELLRAGGAYKRLHDLQATT